MLCRKRHVKDQVFKADETVSSYENIGKQLQSTNGFLVDENIVWPNPIFPIEAIA